MPHLLFWAAAACALAYLPLTTHPASTHRTLLKTGSVALLALLTAFHGGPALLAAALGLCALGDALLSRETEATFMAGIGAFAAGHLAYVALFLTHEASDPSAIATHPAPIAALALLGVVMALLLWPRAGELSQETEVRSHTEKDAIGEMVEYLSQVLRLELGHQNQTGAEVVGENQHCGQTEGMEKRKSADKF